MTPQAPKISPRQALAFTLARQGLVGGVAPLEAVRRLVGVPALYLQSVGQALWARSPGLEPDWLDQALYERRGLVRTWSLRGAAHVLAADDLPLLVATVGAAAAERFAKQLRSMFKLEETAVAAREEAMLGALAGGPLTRKALHEKVPPLLDPRGAAWNYDVCGPAFRGELVYAAPVGSDPAFARRDLWLEDLRWDVPPPAKAWRELLLRYLAAYGPATAADFAHWSGLGSVKRAGEVRASCGDEVAGVAVEGWPPGQLLRSEDLKALLAREAELAEIVLLPKFDALMMAYAHKARLTEEADQPLVFRKGAQVEATLLLGGRVCGTWRIKPGRTLKATVEPFLTLSKNAKRQVEQEFGKLARWLGSADVRVEYGGS